MCVMSMVLDHYTREWPNPSKHWKIDPIYWPEEIPSQPDPGEIKKTLDRINKFMDLIEKAKEIDNVTNQPDCEDPKKVEYLDEIKALKKQLEALEKKVRNQGPNLKNYKNTVAYGGGTNIPSPSAGGGTGIIGGGGHGGGGIAGSSISVADGIDYSKGALLSFGGANNNYNFANNDF